MQEKEFRIDRRSLLAAVPGAALGFAAAMGTRQEACAGGEIPTWDRSHAEPPLEPPQSPPVEILRDALTDPEHLPAVCAVGGGLISIIEYKRHSKKIILKERPDPNDLPLGVGMGVIFGYIGGALLKEVGFNLHKPY